MRCRQYHSSRIIALALLILTPTLIFCGVGQPPVDVNATIAAGIAATQQAQLNIEATISAAIEATQAAGQSAESSSVEPTVGATTSLPSETPTPTIPDPEQARAVILNEVSGAIAQDLTLLESLFAPNATVIDRNGTPNNPSDDTTWTGWANIQRRYKAFFAGGFTSLVLVDLSIQVDGDQAVGTHKGVVLDGTLYPDQGVYSLQKQNNGRWLITKLEFGNQPGYDTLASALDKATPEKQQGKDDGLYVLEVGSQHKYEEPWGGDRGDPCEAWATGNFDDTQPNHRGFNVELLLTNNSDSKVPDAWPISFKTANGKNVKACYYGYDQSGPEPGVTRSLTFFTVVEQGDYVDLITFELNGQAVQLCLDGKGGWWKC